MRVAPLGAYFANDVERIIVEARASAEVTHAHPDGQTGAIAVPFCLWCVAPHPNNYAQALWAAIGGFGDIDTNCAIVGGIIAAGTPQVGIPPSWLEARECISLSRS